MITITKLEPKTYQGKITGYSVTLSDGVSGYLDDKNSDKGLLQGETVNYNSVVKQNKQGGSYNLLTIHRYVANQVVPIPPPSAVIPPQVGKPQLNVGALLQVKADASIKAMEFMVNCFIADKINWDEIKGKHKELTGYLMDAINECASE